jgi:CDP-6-deoxy-D-xylo-4-hexulose-3-dehydrase
MSGALGREQIKKLPGLIEGRRANGVRLQNTLGNHPRFMIQREIGASSWFGFSLVLRDDTAGDRAALVRDLSAAGFECRPIVAGNFAKNEVMQYFDFEIHDQLRNADYIDANGLFVGNHHYPLTDAIKALAKL